MYQLDCHVLGGGLYGMSFVNSRDSQKGEFMKSVDSCPACQGKMKIIAFITDPSSVQRYLVGEGLPTEPPPIAPARLPPQMAFEY